MSTPIRIKTQHLVKCFYKIICYVDKLQCEIVMVKHYYALYLCIAMQMSTL